MDNKRNNEGVIRADRAIRALELPRRHMNPGTREEEELALRQMISGIIPEWQEANDKEEKGTIALVSLWTGELVNAARMQMKTWLEKRNEHKKTASRENIEQDERKGNENEEGQKEKTYEIGVGSGRYREYMFRSRTSCKRVLDNSYMVLIHTKTRDGCLSTPEAYILSNTEELKPYHTIAHAVCLPHRRFVRIVAAFCFLLEYVSRRSEQVCSAPSFSLSGYFAAQAEAEAQRRQLGDALGGDDGDGADHEELEEALDALQAGGGGEGEGGRSGGGD
eukprot:6087572-Pleurochrysis_carterae.AAC.2